MLIPGVRDEHLERLPWNYGGGEGALGYRHLPSGIIVFRRCPPDFPLSRIDQELLTEPREKLRERGVLNG
jgi:hypothetical protein